MMSIAVHATDRITARDRDSVSAVLKEWAESQNYVLRHARKDHRCTGGCRGLIAAGSYYCEGEVDPEVAGGFGRTRYCAECCDRMMQRAATPVAGDDDRRA